MLRRRYLSALCLVAGLYIPGLSQSETAQDLQFWNENTIVIPAVKRKRSGKNVDFVNLLISQNNRLGGDGVQPIDERVGFGADLIVNKYLTLTPSYFYRASRSISMVWDYEHRVRFDVTVGHSWKYLGIKNRNRLERRIITSQSDSTRYRNRTTLRVPVKQNDKSIFDVFSTIEPFADLTTRSWASYEFTSGVSTNVSDSIIAEFFYLHRGKIQSLSQTVNGFGVNIKLRIGQ